jgi:glycosyltransferase involved in cell wall biosynthesis
MNKKALIITTTLDFGGAERTVVDASKALFKSEKYHPIICSLFGRGDMRKEIEDAGIEHHPLNFKSIKNVVPNLISIRRLIKKIQPDIIHTHQFASDFYGSIGAIGLNIPIVSHIQNPDMPQPFSRKIIRFFTSLWLIDHFIAVVEEKTESLLKMIPSAVKRISILHNAVDPKNLTLPKEFSKSKMKSELKIPENNFVIGSVGRMVWEKGYDLLLSAFKKIFEKNPNSSLVLVGDGPELKNLKDMAEKLNISGKVIFAGYQKNTAEWMSLFDIFVVSSKMEAFPLVSLEAMHIGIPLIITDIVSSKKILSRAAMVVPCSEKGIKEGIEKIMENPKLREKMSKNEKKISKEEFSMDSYAEKLEKIYDKILDEK